MRPRCRLVSRFTDGTILEQGEGKMHYVWAVLRAGLGASAMSFDVASSLHSHVPDLPAVEERHDH